MEAAFLSFKMGYLEEQRTQLHSLVDKQVDKVLHMGKTWIEEAEDDAESSAQTFTQTSLLIENTAIFVARKCKEILGADTALSHTIPSTDATVTAVLASSTNVSADLKSMMARLKTVEENVSSLSSDLEKASRKQGDINKCVEDMGSRQSQMDEKQLTSYRELQDKLSNTDVEHRKRLEHTENQLQALEKELSEMKIHSQPEQEEKTEKGEAKKTLELCLQNLEKAVERGESEMKKLSSHVTYVESYCNYDKQLENLGQRIEKVETTSQQLETVKQKVKKLEATSKKLEKIEMFEQKIEKLEGIELKLKEFETAGKKVGKLKTIEQKVESLASLEQKFEELDAATKSLSSRLGECDSCLQKLAASTEANTKELRDSTSLRERDQERMNEIQDKLSAVEKNTLEVVKNFEKKINDVEMQYKMVCCIVSDRLAPLEQLRGIFNKKIKYRDENIKELHDVVQQMSVMEPRVSRLETINMAGEMKEGVQVKRGLDWKWGDQDGPAPSLGRVYKEVDADGWITVQWNTGNVFRYRMGNRGKYDLTLVQIPLTSGRQDEEKQNAQDKLLNSVIAGPELVALMKVGARIKRGVDWKWGNQDGPSPSHGRVIGFGDVDGWVIVQWDTLSFNRYRMGSRGKFDLTFAELPCCLTSIRNVDNDLRAEERLKEQELNKIIRRQEWASILKVGTRIKRGIDWCYGNQDGNPPGLGIVHSQIDPRDLISVRWDAGESSHYFMKQGSYRLSLA